MLNSSMLDIRVEEVGFYSCEIEEGINNILIQFVGKTNLGRTTSISKDKIKLKRTKK